MLRAVLYCRSSKDRADVSIDVQRRELAELAAARGYAVDDTFTDAVESGKDEDRPGLQAMLKALRDRDRKWTAVFVLDTSRIARRAAAAYWFEDRECASRGVKVFYKNVPDMEDAERSIFKAMLHGIDEWHSKVSKRKAIAGMRENVKKGYRAGGRAPTGYLLEHNPTGAIREGNAVMKSRLAPADNAPAIGAYLRDRAAGVPRASAARKHGLKLPPTTLLSVERNALVYAGHTVWNVMGERGQGGPKFRPRAEWEVKRDTHAALITELEAEAILEQLKSRALGARKRKHDHLLAGLLRTPAGRAWHGEVDPYARFYRPAHGRRILARRIEQTVVDTLTQDLAGGRLASALLEHMRARLTVRPDLKRQAALRRRMDEADRKIRRLADLAAGAGAAHAPLLRTMGEEEKARDAAADELGRLEREAADRRELEAVTEDQVKDALRSIAVDVAAAKDIPGLRDQLLQLLDRVEMDPQDPAEVVLHYRLPVLSGTSPGYRWRPHSDTTINPVTPWLERRVRLAA